MGCKVLVELELVQRRHVARAEREIDVVVGAEQLLGQRDLAAAAGGGWVVFAAVARAEHGRGGAVVVDVDGCGSRMGDKVAEIAVGHGDKLGAAARAEVAGHVAELRAGWGWEWVCACVAEVVVDGGVDQWVRVLRERLELCVACGRVGARDGSGARRRAALESEARVAEVCEFSFDDENVGFRFADALVDFAHCGLCVIVGLVEGVDAELEAAVDVFLLLSDFLDALELGVHAGDFLLQARDLLLGVFCGAFNRLALLVDLLLREPVCVAQGLDVGVHLVERHTQSFDGLEVFLFALLDILFDAVKALFALHEGFDLASLRVDVRQQRAEDEREIRERDGERNERGELGMLRGRNCS
eukprot:comp22460_c0_seq2/m.55353 comp22460_c0_seq2/g.55353  ORF comp22460_c0_seq2/g.55353 comp22460_c0_seq2/m.55353 type:complete len:358 (-) comp22460_c0_seq2:102-1175(-)